MSVNLAFTLKLMELRLGLLNHRIAHRYYCSMLNLKEPAYVAHYVTKNNYYDDYFFYVKKKFS